MPGPTRARHLNVAPAGCALDSSTALARGLRMTGWAMGGHTAYQWYPGIRVIARESAAESLRAELRKDKIVVSRHWPVSLGTRRAHRQSRRIRFSELESQPQLGVEWHLDCAGRPVG
jgi:hypothetical protein